MKNKQFFTSFSDGRIKKIDRKIICILHVFKNSNSNLRFLRRIPIENRSDAEMESAILGTHWAC